MTSGGLKILLVGAGPVGSLILADLFLRFRTENAGGKIYWLVRNDDKRAAFLKNGLIVKPANESSADAELNIDFGENQIVELLDWEGAAGMRFDAAVMAVKAYSLNSALESVKSVSPGTPVLAVVNGLIESNDFLLGVSFGGGAMTGNLLDYTEKPRIHYGISVYEKGAQYEYCECAALIEMLREFADGRGLIEWREDAGIHRTMLEKVTVNSIVNPLTAILNAQNKIMIYPELLPVIKIIASEICDALNAKYPSYAFDIDNAVKTVHYISESTSVNFSSMLQDVSSGRENETAYLNAKIADIAAKFGIATPLNRWVLDMISAVTRAPVE